jgi:hypothetical protein
MLQNIPNVNLLTQLLSILKIRLKLDLKTNQYNANNFGMTTSQLPVPLIIGRYCTAVQ